MKKTERKILKEKILTGIKQILKTNKAGLTKKTEKKMRKTIKAIVKNTAKHAVAALPVIK